MANGILFFIGVLINTCYVLADYIKHESELFQGNLPPDKVADYYDKWSEKYDKELVEVFKAPFMAAKTLASVYGPSVRPSVKILDVGAGTGLVADELSKHGFQKIEALDPSQGMLDKAKEKNIYKKFICDFLNKDSLHEYNGTYDCLVTAATFVPGHIPPEALYDFVRLTKKGGNVVIAMRTEWTDTPSYSESVKSTMDQIEKEGKWKKIMAEPYNHYYHHEGTCYVFNVL